MGAITTIFFAAMTSAEAIAVMLNSAASCSKSKYEEAKRIVIEDARAGKPLQQFLLGVNTDDVEASEKLRKASKDKLTLYAEERNNPLAWYVLSLEDNNFAFLKRAADGGNVQALNALGSISMQEVLARKGATSNEVQRVLKRSFDYFRQAAAQRDANAFINLGTCYLRGFGCQQDMEMSFRCFMTAAEMGHPEGMDDVSAAYQFGHGVKPDAELSLFWAMKARTLRGDEAAAKWLATRKLP